MMSRGKITPGSLSYYTDVVATGIEDYYAGRGEAPGFWTGSGARAAGIEGEVSAEQLAALFDMRHPVTGEPLGDDYVVPEGRDRVYGWDLTCSAPKSVSSLWAVGGGAIGIEVRDAHDVAVQAGMAYLEEHAAFGRQGKAGIRQVDTDGLVAAAFVHRVSRNGDPQLHTHLLISNRVRCSDGVWRALDSKALHPQIKPAGMIYQAALRAELTARLGVVWSPVSEDGQAEIHGVPEPLQTKWSTRRRDIEAAGRVLIAEQEAKLERALTPAERRIWFERAALSTRSAKDRDGVSDAGLHDQWTRDAEELGYPAASWIPDTVNRAPERARAITAEMAAMHAVAELEESCSTWTRAELVKRISRLAPASCGDATAAREWVEHTTDLALGLHGVVSLAAPEPAPPASLRRRDGRSVYDPHNATKYTTTRTLEIEQHVLDAVTRGRDAHRAEASVSHVEDAITRSALDDDQANAVRRIALGGDAVVCVVGPAGAGKTRAMAAAVTAWQTTGVPVRGLAVSASAAGVLQAEAGMRADTIAKLLFEHDRRNGPDDTLRIRTGEVLLVDEAGMVPSRQLARLITLSQKCDAKVVLVGDHAQLGAVEAGGLFRLLARDSNAAELTSIRRFANQWEADASVRLRDRKPAAIRAYDEHDRIVGGDRQAMLDQAFTRWRHARATGSSVVICARDYDTVDAFNQRARDARVLSGEVQPEGVLVGEQTVGVGDEIVTTRNDRRLVTTRDGWVRNGDRWTVHACHPGGSLTVDDLAGRGRVTLPADYVAEHVALAYAVTIHKAQGVTVDNAILIADAGISAEALYVGMTRGRHDNTALVVTDPIDLDRHRPEPPVEPAAVLVNALGRDTAERSAIDELRHTLDRSESLAVLNPRLANLDTWIREHEPVDKANDLDKARGKLAAFEQHAKPGRLTRRGRDDQRTLDALADKVDRLAEHQQQRETWLVENDDTLEYRGELLQQITKRRAVLCRQALADQPDHLVDLLGSVPELGTAAQRWALRAGRIEAYREEWSIHPNELRRRPTDGVQRAAWDHDVQGPVDNAAFEQRQRDQARQRQLTRQRGVQRGVEIEHDFGIDL